MAEHNRITVIWLSATGATPTPERDEPPMNRAQRRQWAAIERQLLENTKSWPRYRCAAGHLAAADPIAEADFADKPCAHCGEPVSRDVKRRPIEKGRHLLDNRSGSAPWLKSAIACA
jgi:hypothetical protein